MSRSESEWRKLVDLFEGSGLQRAAFCTRERITVHALDKWRARLGRTRPKSKCSSRAVRASTSHCLPPHGLVPVALKAQDQGLSVVRVTVVLEHRALRLEGSAADLTQLLRCL